VLAMLGGPQAAFDDLGGNTRLKGGWIVGGYLSEWIGKATFPRGFKVVQDILPNKLTETADVLLPAALWAEKDGSWENYSGHIQPFGAAIAPPEGTRREGDVYLNLLGRNELYNAQAIRREMGDPFASIKLETAKTAQPAFEFAEL
jgi:anaerobic selenocysteine-containing dehydrogenase